jgi:hypothetical protein
VRTFDPPPPPHATTLRLNYVRGGGMLLRGAFGVEEQSPKASFLVRTEQQSVLELDEPAWKKAGVPVSQLQPLPEVAAAQFGDAKHGLLPMLRIGAFEVPQVPTLFTPKVSQIEELLGIDLDGTVGSGLFTFFRVTLVDAGRTMWLEDMPAEAFEMAGMTPPRRTDAPAPAEPAAEGADGPEQKPATSPAAAPPGAAPPTGPGK